jgi:predicted nucleic acid-binding protein
MPPIDVVADANIALKWFHTESEQEVEEARALLTAHRDRSIVLYVLDLTFYELGNALLRGRPGYDGERAARVIEALAEICPAIAPTPKDLNQACRLAEQHSITLYDAAYAAVARRHDAFLATLDHQLLTSGLGQRPAELLAAIAETEPPDSQT